MASKTPAPLSPRASLIRSVALGFGIGSLLVAVVMGAGEWSARDALVSEAQAAPAAGAH